MRLLVHNSLTSLEKSLRLSLGMTQTHVPSCWVLLHSVVVFHGVVVRRRRRRRR